jgi:hypothetical protein
VPQTTPFTDDEIAAIRRFCGYGAYALFGYTLEPGMATLDQQLSGMSDSEQSIVRTEFLAVLPGLRDAIVSAGANLDTDSAAVWTHNKREVQDRTALFRQKCRELCDYCKVPHGRGIGGGPQLVRC